MKYLGIWTLTLFSAAGLAAASEPNEAASVARHQAVVQVKGVVCSYCAEYRYPFYEDVYGKQAARGPELNVGMGFVF